MSHGTLGSVWLPRYSDWRITLLSLATLVSTAVIASPAAAQPTPAVQALIDEIGTLQPFVPDPVARAEFFDYLYAGGGPKDNNDDELPPRLVWTDVNGTDFTTPSRSQGCCGSCVHFAFISAMEVGLKWRYRDVFIDPGFDLDLSEWQLALTYTNGSAANACGQYAVASTFGSVLENHGTVLERELPFPEVYVRGVAEECLYGSTGWGRGNEDRIAEPFPSNLLVFRAEAGSFRRVDSRLATKQALIEGPVVVGMKALDTVQIGGTGTLIDCLNDTNIESGDTNHAVAIIGYDDTY